MIYSLEDIEKAKKLVSDLEEFSNKDISHIANFSKVTDKTRRGVILDLLVEEFGEAILSKGIYKPFGDDCLTAKTDYKKS